MIAKKHWLLLSLPFLMWSCSDDEGKPQKPKAAIDYAQQEAQGYITVLGEDGNPVAGAKILIGSALNVPFEGNFLTTNANGQVMKPAAWSEALPVTVQANGHVRLTHFGRAPGGATFRLSAASQMPTIEIGGKTTGHTVKDRDGLIDFGLVMSAMSRADILAFDLTKVISNRVDTISIIGQKLEVPANISLPAQRESYILPFKIEKPNYRLSFGKTGTQRLFAAQGRFPFKAVMNDARGDVPFYELVNHFTITGGVVRDVQVRNGLKTDLPVNELKFTKTRTLRAPALRGGEVMISLAVADMNGWLIPTDVKKLGSNESKNMAIIDNGTPLALGVLKNADEFSSEGGMDRLSAVLVPFTGALTPQFMPLIRDPRVMADGHLQFDRPTQAPAGVNALATLAIYSEVKELSTGNGKSLPFLSRLWEVYAPAWVEGMDLPVWPEGTPKPLKKRWEVAYIGSQSQQNAELGQAVIDAATHVTHSSKDF